MKAESGNRHQETEHKDTTAAFRIFRYNPSKSKEVTFTPYDVPIAKGMTILEALLYIKEKLDSTVTFMYSCRMGICGACGMVVNGREKLACMTQVDKFGKNCIEIRPLNNMPVIRDLVADFHPFLQNNIQIKPYIMGDGVDRNLNREFKQTPQDLNEYLIFADCIKCGLCCSACPTSATDMLYLGPQALTQAYRFIADSRDEGQKERMEIIDKRHGLWNCHFAGTCSDVCPKGVDPAFAIQQLKALAIWKSNLLARKERAPYVETGRKYVKTEE